MNECQHAKKQETLLPALGLSEGCRSVNDCKNSFSGKSLKAVFDISAADPVKSSTCFCDTSVRCLVGLRCK